MSETLSVASGGMRDTVPRTPGAASLTDLFSIVVTMGDVANGKPAPDLFLLATTRMGVDPRKCLVFEDWWLGVEGARAAGMEVVFVDPEAEGRERSA